MRALLENKGEVGSLMDIQNGAMGKFSVSSFPSQHQTLGNQEAVFVVMKWERFSFFKKQNRTWFQLVKINSIHFFSLLIINKLSETWK